MTIRLLALVVISSSLFVAGCSTPPRIPVPQESKVGDPPIVFSGSYDARRTKLTLTANDEPIIRGTFPPYTPVLNLDTTYQGKAVRAECYFASVLNEKGGLVSIIASSVQSGNGKTGDVCNMLVDTQDAATLRF